MGMAMHRTKRYPKLIAVISVIALVATACGDDQEASVTTTQAPTDAPDEMATDSQLVIGTLLPVTGDSGFLGAAGSGGRPVGCC